MPSEAMSASGFSSSPLYCGRHGRLVLFYVLAGRICHPPSWLKNPSLRKNSKFLLVGGCKTGIYPWINMRRTNCHNGGVALQTIVDFIYKVRFMRQRRHVVNYNVVQPVVELIT